MTSARFGALWLVFAAIIAGMVMIGLDQVRLGGFVIAGAITAGALMRLLLPPGRAGGLAVRSRSVDVLFLVAMAVAMFLVVITLDLGPRG